MRTIVHLSDLHFGTVEREILAPLKQTILAAHPNLIAVSGDLTQRARRQQFVEARAFLDSLPFPKLVVPGNHDVPLYNFYARFADGLKRYRKYICADTEPFYQDDEIAVLGINTARSLTFKGGRISERQVELARERLAPLTGLVKIIVTHHPFDLPEHYSERALVGRARMAISAFAEFGIDLFLAGHHHVGFAQPSTWRFKINGHSALLIQAGTATSTRRREELNSFNILGIDGATISVKRMVWSSQRGFVTQADEVFRGSDKGWTLQGQQDQASQISTDKITPLS
ncbi:MAG TPA: metallophosphoesterase family protein [Candidatus Limnocylindrales bacterium]|nr:metallophosphoesterase family protein [Candidatus Limnocylindrales bacterium]